MTSPWLPPPPISFTNRTHFRADDASPARLMCNGWRQHDVVKIFSRPARGGRSSCCDLTIRLVQGALATMYGVVWADPDFLGSCERHGWRQENVSNVSRKRFFSGSIA